MTELRDYQVEAVEKLETAIKLGQAEEFKDVDRQFLFDDLDIAGDQLWRVGREAEDVAGIGNDVMLPPSQQHLAIFPDLVLSFLGAQQRFRIDKMTVHPARAAFSMSSGASLPRELCCSSCGGRHRFARNEAAERAFRQWRPREDDAQDAQDPTQGPAA